MHKCASRVELILKWVNSTLFSMPIKFMHENKYICNLQPIYLDGFAIKFRRR